ncbi:MAG: MmgE/PrpD family protein [Duodenibacillus sp.]|nr:MmgE/PrpD family protein [Duodenibacillus sp.]
MTDTWSPSAACAEFAAGLTYDAIDPAAVDVIKRDTLDWLGCAIKGAADASSAPIKALAAAVGGKEQATALGDGRRSVVQAAMNNAYCGHIFEMDDVDRDSISHPGTVVIAPALAVSEFAGADGRAFLAAVVAGFEVMLRIGAAITPAHYKVFHTTATTGVFGAAMAAGKLLGLPAPRMGWALGNAGTSAAGLWQFLPDGAMSKFWHTANAAGTGVEVALLAKEGFSGPSRILEGDQGFFKGYARQEVDMDLFRDFGKKWRAGLISFKPYPTCRHTHSAIDAAEEIRAKAAGRKLAKVSLYTYSTATNIAGTRAPDTVRKARFSITWLAACTLLKGIVNERMMTEAVLNDPEVVALEKAIDMVVDPEIDARVPANWPCRIEAVTEDGERLVAQVWSPTGDPERTLDWEGAAAKFRIMTEGVIPPETQERIIEGCRRLEEMEHPGELLAAAQAAIRLRY